MAASRCCGRTAPIIRARLSPAAACPGLGGDVDGDDNVWVSNFAIDSPMCSCAGRARRTVRPDMKTGDQIRRPVVTLAEDCRCKPISLSIPQGTSG